MSKNLGKVESAKLIGAKKYLMYLLENTTNSSALSSIKLYLDMIKEENVESILNSAEKLVKIIGEDGKYIIGNCVAHVSDNEIENIENNDLTWKEKSLLKEITNIDEKLKKIDDNSKEFSAILNNIKDNPIGERLKKMENKSNYNDFINGLDKINDISELEDDQIIKLREKLKEIDVKLKEKAKPKTITISGEAHNIIKEHCSLIKENVGEWSEKILVNTICLPAISEQNVYLIDYNTHSVDGKLYQCHSWIIENDVNEFLHENSLKGNFYLYYKESINIDPTTLGASNFKTKITGFFA